MEFTALPPKQPKIQTLEPEGQRAYSLRELGGSIPRFVENEASYFEKAQDFRQQLLILRIKYLGLREVRGVDAKGNQVTNFVRDPKLFTGINEEGVEANLRFLETRLGQPTVLTNWGDSKDGEMRMQKVILDDMNTWYWMMVQNMERYELDPATMRELRILVNDLLEYIYRRSLDDKERSNMRPTGSEVKRMLGMDRESEDIARGYANNQNMQKMRSEAEFGTRQ